MKNKLIECGDYENITGFKKENLEISKDILCTNIEIDSDYASRKTGYEKGNYHLINFNYDKISFLETKLIKILKDILKNYSDIKGDVLLVGLGNKDIVCDSLGHNVLKNIFIGQDEFNTKIKLKSLEPSVLGKTGIESFDIIKGVVNQIKPNMIIVIDTLAAGDFSRLFKSIQISNTSITPGSGVDNARKKISKNTLGIPVIVIGIPMLISVENLIEPLGLNLASQEEKRLFEVYKSLWVSPKDVDFAVKEFSYIISTAINESFYKEFNSQELAKLVRAYE